MSLTGNAHKSLPMLCCLWLPSNAGIFVTASIVLLGIRSDPIVAKHFESPLLTALWEDQQAYPGQRAHVYNTGQGS